MNDPKENTMTDTDTTTKDRPVYGQPTYEDRDPWLTYAEQEPAHAGWDLAFGCKLSFGPHENGGALRVEVHMSDRELRNGCCVRTVTPEQVYAFAQHLIRLVALETGELRCRTNGVGAHGPAVALVDGEPRCDICAAHVPADDPRREPLPATQPTPKLETVA